MIVLVPERGTEMWRAAHRSHICASDSKLFMARPGTKAYTSLVNRLVLDFEGHGLHTDETPDPWEEQHEIDLIAALAHYRRSTQRSVITTGFVTHSKFTWLGASPHGFLGSRGLLHFRIRKSLRAWHAHPAPNRSELARLQLSMAICDRNWCELVDYWSGEGRVPDRMTSRRIEFDHTWLLTNAFPRLVALWDQIRRELRKRESDDVRAAAVNPATL